jgi:hypothetical protein
MFFALGTGDRLRDAFVEAGFADVTRRRLSSILHYNSAEEACGAAFAGGPVALAYSRFDAGMRDGAHAEYLDSIGTWRAGDGYDVPGEFVVGTGVVPPG